jgi:hypothetical protein
MNRSRLTRNGNTDSTETKQKTATEIKKTAPIKWLHRTSLTTAQIIYNKVFNDNLQENRKAV